MLSPQSELEPKAWQSFRWLADICYFGLFFTLARGWRKMHSLKDKTSPLKCARSSSSSVRLRYLTSNTATQDASRIFTSNGFRPQFRHLLSFQSSNTCVATAGIGIGWRQLDSELTR